MRADTIIAQWERLTGVLNELKGSMKDKTLSLSYIPPSSLRRADATVE